MAYRKPNDLDGFIQLMPKADMRVKVQLAEDLVTFLSDDTNSIVCMDMGLLVDGLMPWLTGSHFKIAQKSLEAFTELIKRLGPDFNAYTATVLPHVIDRLGDSKDTVREKAQLLLQALMEHKVLTPQNLLDKLAANCFKHKNAKVREEFLQTIINALNEYGTAQLSVRNYIQPICILLGDPTVSVRDTAIQSLVEIYKHVGDRLRPDLRRKDEMPATKLAILEQKFDQIKGEGLLLKSATLATQTPSSSSSSNTNNGYDEADNIATPRDRPTKIVKRTVSATMRSKSNATTDSGDAGAVTMEIFESSFEAVPQLNIFHPKDMDDVYRNVLSIISDKNYDWEKRIESLKKIRSLLMANIQAQPQFMTVQLKELSISFLDIVKEELRSQVIREACITIAFMSKTLQQKLDKFCEYILEQLIMLIQNSVKVIASSSSIALKYIIKYTHAPKLVKIITEMLQNSKSKDIRAALCEILCLLCDEWPTKAMERCAPILRDAIKKSMSDADSEARRHSRRAYWLFRRHFPDLADQIYGNLDIAAQKALERERDGAGGGGAEQERRATVAPASRIQRSPGSIQKPAPGMRSISAVDTAAAQRAKTRAQYAFLARKKAANTATSSAATGSLPRPRLGAAPQQPTPQLSTVSPRSRGRAGVSQSQPGSRSTSPSSKLREQHGIGSYYRPTGTIPKKASGIPRSLASSRETSPTRGASGSGGGAIMKRSMYNTGTSRRTPERNQPTRQLAAARLLQQSRDAENALADALSPDGGGDFASMGDYGRDRGGGSFSAGTRIGRKLMSREESDDSEASSVCSERSFDSSYTRGNYSNYSGSRNRLDYSLRSPIDDIDTIIQYCASTHWAERKDGLLSLTQYLADGRELTPQQLQMVLDTFRKMFMDSHTKVYSLFLETVNELILAYANDLHDWLFILLTRLFNKLGTELLNSMHGKIWKSLQLVHEYFPTDLQMKDVFRILSDSAQTPCTKTRIAILKFLTSLANAYCKNTDFPGANEGVVMPIVEKALQKIVQMAGDQKSLELRNQARQCLIALYNLNTPQMTKVLSALPKGYQDSAKVFIQSHLRRSSTSGTNSPSSSPLSSSSPKPLHSPNVSGPFSSLQPQFTSPRSRQSSATDNELMLGYSEVDVQQNIQKTTEEIRNCFGGIENQYNSMANNSNGGGGYNGHLSEALDSCTSSNSKTQSATTTESNTPESTTMRLDGNLLNQHHKMTASTLGSGVAPTNSASASVVTLKYDDNGEVIFENGLHESEVMKVALNLTPDMPVPQVQNALKNLGICIKGGNCELPNKNFRVIMKMLLNMLDAQSNEVVIEALHVLSKILRRPQMKPNWINFVELILLKIINCYPKSKDTMRELDSIIPRIVPALPLNLTVNIVNPVIATGTYPVNLCALKLLTELADRHGSELTENQLEIVFPHLARLTDDYESMVRKAAVFCIVKLYIVMGEEKVKPKLTMLNPSKVRLLNVYIEKQRGASSGGGSSTKNSSASSS